MEIHSLLNKAIKINNMNIIQSHNYLILDILIIYSLMKKEENKSEILMKNSKHKINPNSYNNLKFNKVNKNNKTNKRKKNKILKCIFLMVSVKIL